MPWFYFDGGFILIVVVILLFTKIIIWHKSKSSLTRFSGFSHQVPVITPCSYNILIFVATQFMSGFSI